MDVVIVMIILIALVGYLVYMHIKGPRTRMSDVPASPPVEDPLQYLRREPPLADRLRKQGEVYPEDVGRPAGSPSPTLDECIRMLVSNGYQIMFRNQTTAQLIKRREFNLFFAVVGLLFFIVGLLVYLLIYFNQRDEQIYLEVEPSGEVLVR